MTRDRTLGLRRRRHSRYCGGARSRDRGPAAWSRRPGSQFHSVVSYGLRSRARIKAAENHWFSAVFCAWAVALKARAGHFSRVTVMQIHVAGVGRCGATWAGLDRRVRTIELRCALVACRPNDGATLPLTAAFDEENRAKAQRQRPTGSPRLQHSAAGRAADAAGKLLRWCAGPPDMFLPTFAPPHAKDGAIFCSGRRRRRPRETPTPHPHRLLRSAG